MNTKTMISIILLVLITNCLLAQRAINMGFTGGVSRYTPDLDEKFNTSRNNAMENGWGYSAGLFIEDSWKSKIHQIIEVNFLSLYSDVFLENNSSGQGGYGTGGQPVYKLFENTAFNYFTVSGGVKYFINDKIFLYPGFEWARSLNNDVDINKSTYHLKLAAGINFRKLDLIIEYNYGLRSQRRIYYETVPFVSTHRNKFLQLKVQVPLYRLL